MKDTNVTLTDLRGKREVHHITEEPQGIWAAMGRVTPEGVRAAMSVVLGLGMLLSVESGLVAPFAASVAVGLGLHLLGGMDAEETETTHVIEEEGMSAREVEELVILNDEHKTMKRDEMKKQTRKAKHSPNGGSP